MNIQLLNLGAAISRLQTAVQDVGQSNRDMADQLTAAVAAQTIDTTTIEAVAKQINDMADKLDVVAAVSIAAPAQAVP